MIFALLARKQIARCKRIDTHLKDYDMQKYSIITFIAFFLYSTSGLKAETPPVTSLSDGIAAFICNEIDNIMMYH